MDGSELIKKLKRPLRGNAMNNFEVVMRMLVGDYDPSQPRDENGRWTDTGNINTSVTGYQSGQMDLHMSYTQGGKEAGYIDYAEYDGVPFIKYITVDPEFRRQGIATKMLKQLQKEYPDQEIDWGMTTPDGTKLKEKVAVKIENKTAIKVNKALNQERGKLNTIEAKLNELYEATENRDPTDEESAAFEKYGKAWDKSYAKVRALEDVAEGMKEYKYMIPID